MDNTQHLIVYSLPTPSQKINFVTFLFAMVECAPTCNNNLHVHCLFFAYPISLSQFLVDLWFSLTHHLVLIYGCLFLIFDHSLIHTPNRNIVVHVILYIILYMYIHALHQNIAKISSNYTRLQR